ncbi:hypothetical protein [Desulfovirgula thermocuniculi]|uniref:hypothetical protein n=1 Tax=Desulfovirgula thermocuniculi TaxID=348842 RepID=UPI0003FBFFCE|nr:hypothetical protein [Desulfovirgula thermocuniculi]
MPLEVRVEPLLRRPGLVTSPGVLRLLEFLEACGGATPAACALLFRGGEREARRRMDSLRAAAYAARAFLAGEELWLPRAHSVWDPASFLRQRALGWFAARLAQSGGRVSGGTALFPSGDALPVAVLPFDALPPGRCVAVVAAGAKAGDLPPGYFWCREEDLEASDLPSCMSYAE